MSQLWCAVWGHEVDNHKFLEESGERRCRCGTRYLGKDGTLTHVRHTLSCFLGHHTYKKLIERDGHTEYVCVQCGHPLLFQPTKIPIANRPSSTRRFVICAGSSATTCTSSAIAMGTVSSRAAAATRFSRPSVT